MCLDAVHALAAADTVNIVSMTVATHIYVPLHGFRRYHCERSAQVNEKKLWPIRLREEAGSKVGP